MTDKISIFEWSKLPPPFGVTLLVLSLIFLLSPYLSGADFGIFKIPNFSQEAKRWLKIVGPGLFAACVISFLPVFHGSSGQKAMCPQVGGAWKMNDHTTLMKIDQKGCSISAQLLWQGFEGKVEEKLAGVYIEKGYFDASIYQTEGGCQEVMYGKLYSISENQIKLQIYAGEGRCDASPWTGDLGRIWDRL